MNLQEENLERVTERIAQLVIEFCERCVAVDDSLFYMEDLREYVYARVDGYIAPDSPGRILRMLRQKKALKYVVLSRADSFYEVEMLPR